MNRFLSAAILAFLSFGVVFPSVQFRLKNSAFIYNAENTAYWEETRTTVTYLEDLVQPYFVFTVNSNIEFRAGAGLLVPFDQEGGIAGYFPYVQSRFKANGWELILGSLDSDHDFPEPILDPLTAQTPRVRVLSKSQIPIDYEYFPEGLDSHGQYEYGLQTRWDLFFGRGDLYINWQLADTVNHRERFDVGLIHSWEWLYGAFHYWHNGGHENPHPVAITEDYTAAIGLKTTNFSVLYLASYFIPDREQNPQLNVFGEALYGEYRFDFFGFEIVLHGFVSDRLIMTNHQFISIEGDPFYRVPVYLGLDIFRSWEFDKDIVLKIGFVNGIYMAYPEQTYNWDSYRYDQSIRADMEFKFDLLQEKA